MIEVPGRARPMHIGVGVPAEADGLPSLKMPQNMLWPVGTTDLQPGRAANNCKYFG